MNGTRFCECGCGAIVAKRFASGHNKRIVQVDPICSIVGCESQRRSVGAEYCEVHYYRLRRTGTTDLRPREPSDWSVCREVGCNKLARTRGGTWCGMHYKRDLSAYGERAQNRADRDKTMRDLYEAGLSTTKVGAQLDLDASYVSRTLRTMGVSMREFGASGSNHPNWAGDHPTYSSAHMRVRATRGSARNYVCACGQRAAQWAYMHDDPNGLQSDLGPYSADPAHYEAMCVSCHKLLDLARLK